MATERAGAWADGATAPSANSGRLGRSPLRLVIPFLFFLVVEATTAADGTRYACLGRPASLAHSCSPLLGLAALIASKPKPTPHGSGGTEAAAPAASMLRRRQQADPTDSVAVPEEVELDSIGAWLGGDVGGDKGWLLGGDGGGGGGGGNGAPRPPQWPFCAWEGTLTRNISNIFALENSAAYHFLAPWMKFQGLAGVPTFRISGVYPRTAFFDFSSYSRGYTKAIDAIADYQIKPCTVGVGVNG